MRLITFLFAVVLLTLPSFLSAADTWKSHRPLRVVPATLVRPLPAELILVVDAAKGDNNNPGTETASLRSVQIAIDKTTPGTTVVLRGDVYFERLVIAARGSTEQPISVRSWPGETVIIDGGWPEFSQTPQIAWQPVEGSASGEFRSTKKYPNVREAIGANYVDETDLRKLPLIVAPFRLVPLWIDGAAHVRV